MTRGEELLQEDSWTFVRMDGNLQLWRKFNLFVYYNPARDTFSQTFIGDPLVSKTKNTKDGEKG